jgi:hypothetical protein
MIGYSVASAKSCGMKIVWPMKAEGHLLVVRASA